MIAMTAQEGGPAALADSRFAAEAAVVHVLSALAAELRDNMSLL